MSDMTADGGGVGLAESLVRARIALFDLAPENRPDTPSEPDSIEACALASAAIADLLAKLEHGDDALRALLAADMALAIDDGPSATRRGGGSLAAILDQALSVLDDAPPDGGVAGHLPSRSPLALANELRALRGAPLLSGNAVFAIAVDAGTPDTGDDDESTDSGTPAGSADGGARDARITDANCHDAGFVMMYDTYAQALYLDGPFGPLTGIISTDYVVADVDIELDF